MASGNYVLDKGYNAAAALTKFYAVKMTGNPEEVGPVTANTDEVHGFAQFGVTAAEILRGKGSSVRLMGITEAVAVGPIADGQWVTLEADGRVSALVNASGKTIVGKCVGFPSTNAGDRISLWLIPLRAKA